jgi:hypothetical protein
MALPTYLAGLTSEQVGLVLWHGVVGKVSSRGVKHARAVIVNASDILVALPSGELTRDIPLEVIRLLVVDQKDCSAVIRTSQDHDLVLTFVGASAVDKFVSAVQQAYLALTGLALVVQGPAALSLPVRENDSSPRLSSPKRSHDDSRSRIGLPEGVQALEVELVRSRRVIADLQEALRSQDDIFLQYMRVQEEAAAVAETKQVLAKQCEALQQEVVAWRAEVIHRDEEIVALRSALDRSAARHAAELEQIKQAFVAYDRLVGEQVRHSGAPVTQAGSSAGVSLNADRGVHGPTTTHSSSAFALVSPNGCGLALVDTPND